MDKEVKSKIKTILLKTKSIKVLFITLLSPLLFLLVCNSLLNVKATTDPIFSIGNFKATQSQQITIPLTISEGYDITALDLSVSFDEDVLVYKGISKGNLFSNFLIDSNASNGLLQIGMAGTNVISGSGTVVNITFEVNSDSLLTASDLVIVSHLINEGEISSSSVNGKITIVDGFNFSGKVKYYSNQGSVYGVSISLDGNTTKSNSSNKRGAFIINSLPVDNYVISASKSDETGNAISAYDASLVLRSSVGLIDLSSNQILAGDVTGNGTLSAYDASIILQKSVGKISGNYPDIDKLWTFLLPSTEANITEDFSNGDIIALLLGDVSGNWVSPSPDIPILPSIEVINGDTTSISLQFNSDSSVEKYEVYESHNGSAYSLLSTQTEANYAKSGLIDGDVYKYKIRSYFTDGNRKIYSLYSDIVEKIDYISINLLETNDFESLDLQKNYGYLNTSENVFEGLIRNGEVTNSIVPGVAESWTYNTSTFTWTFKLNSNASWVNYLGEKQRAITANDFVYSWDRLFNNNYPYSFLLSELKIVDYYAADNTTFKVVLSENIPYFLTTIINPAFYPIPYELETTYGENYASDIEKTWYNGPFYASTWNINKDMTWTKNPYYWDAEVVKTPSVHILIDEQIANAQTLFEQGLIDYIRLSNVSASDYKDNSNAIIKPDTAVFYLTLNVGNAGRVGSQITFDQAAGNDLLDNLKIRQAIAYYIDKDELTNSILDNGSTPAYYIVPSNFVSLNETPFESKRGDGYLITDKIKARTLFTQGMSELGYTSGNNNLSLNLLVYESLSADAVMGYIKTELESLFSGYGITVTLTNLPFADKLMKQENGDFEVSIDGWGPDYVWPESYLNVWMSTGVYNNVGFSNSTYDELLSTNGKTNAEIFSDLQDAEKILVESATIIPLYHRAKIDLQNSNLKNLYTPIMYTYPLSLKWAYKQYDFQSLEKVYNISILKEENNFTLSWDLVKGAKGYEIYQSTNGANYTLIGVSTDYSYQIDDVDINHTYYYKIRAYKTYNDEKIYGQYGVSSTRLFDSEQIALITSLDDENTINLAGFDHEAWVGIQKFGDEFDIQYSYYVPNGQNTSDYLLAIENAVNEGAKVIVLTGNTLSAAVYKAQSLYPDVRFILIDAEPHTEDYSSFRINRNVESIYFHEHEAGFIAGYAAVKNGSRELGFIGGMAVPSVVRYGLGFIQGADYAAQHLNVNVHINTLYANSFSEDNYFVELAKKIFLEGTEVIFTSAGGVDLSIIEAADQLSGEVITADYDHMSYSNSVLTSINKNVEKAVYNSLVEEMSGYFKGGQVVNYGIVNDYLKLPSDFTRFSNFDETEYNSLISNLKQDQNNIRSSIISDTAYDFSQLNLPNTSLLNIEDGVYVKNFIGSPVTHQFGLRENITYSFNNSVLKGRVISQSISVDTHVSFGTTLNLVVSKGSGIIVSNFVGGTTYTQTGINVTKVEEYSESVASGVVMSQSISSGTKVDEGTSITLVVSLGEQPITLAPLSPMVANTTTSYAFTETFLNTYLQSIGFTNYTFTKGDYGLPSGQIYSQSPSSGDYIKSTSITVLIQQ